MTNLYDVLRDAYSPSRDQPFLRTEDQVIAYAEIDDRSAAFAGALVASGAQRGDRVVVQVDKSIDAVALYLGCVRAGLVYVPLNTAYTPAEVANFVSDARPHSVVTNADFAALRREADSARPLTDVATTGDDELAAMLFTSGTTGRSKGAMLTHSNLIENGRALHQVWGFEPGDVLLHILPIFHVHGLFVALHTAMLNGSEVIFSPRFDPAETRRQLPHATVMMGVPTHYSRLLADPDFGADDCTSIRLFTSGSAPMTEQVHAAFTERTGHRIVERYGMTECGIITSNPLDGDRIPGTVGFPLPRYELRIDPPGDVGIVEVRGPHLFAGYWELPDKTAAEMTSDGFFRTGDLGSLDAEGRLTLAGRSGDLIISGGLNIYPKEIEQVLDELVEESAVVGTPDDDFGERVVAFIVAGDGVDEAVLRRHVDGRLARFKHPARYVVVEALPRNTMGKIQKAELRSRLGP